MPLQKILPKPGINRENTRYTTEGGWYEGDKVRFRQGTPEQIGGWKRISGASFLGVCRSIWSWVTLESVKLLGVGTNLKFYIGRGGNYYDITPLRTSPTINNNPFALTASTTVTVTDTAHGCETGDFVTFSGATDIGAGGTNVTASVLNREFQVTVIDSNTYTITISVTPNATAIAGSPGGGASVVAAYQINTGAAYQIPLSGWGAGGWGLGTWGTGTASVAPLRLWSQANFGENLIFGPRGGGIYYWQNVSGVTTRGENIASLLGALNPPTVQNYLLVSDASRFILAFGTNDIGSAVQDPMLIRWSDQESVTDWTPTATNQAGGIRLSHGSQIVTAAQTRQEILVWTDSSLYSLQYLGPPYVWGSQLLGDNISIIGQNATAVASGVTFWMGVDKFYMYDGTVKTLRCDLRKFVYSDINLAQAGQVFAGTNEGFNEVWWFFCSAESTVVDKYVIYNYAEDVWSYGTMGRTAWLDSGINDYPLAATYSHNLVQHEYGLNDEETDTPIALNGYIQSSEFDIGDGHNFAFIWRVLPDLTFVGSTAASPSVTMTLYTLRNSGSGYTTPGSVGGSNNAVVTQTAVLPVEKFTGQIYTRVRGRQISMRIEANQLDTTWQLGAPRIDIRQDGRR